MIKQRAATIILAILAAGGIFFTTAQAQSGLTLKVRRMFGLGLGSMVRSNLELTASGPEDLRSVTFQIDGQTLQEVSTGPYYYTFHTDQYTPGWHELSAVGRTNGGAILTSNVARYQFLSRAEANRILFPCVGVILVIFGVMVLVRFGSFRRKGKIVPLGAARNYGSAGGTICPRCGRPFPFHSLAIHFLVGILDVCEHCGRWGIYHKRTKEELSRSEAYEVISGQQDNLIQGIGVKNKLRRELEESRFEDQN